MANRNIYTGIWLDHDRNPVLGATITLEAQWGQNLISAATIVVQLAGIALWVILAYLLHHRRSTAGLRDEFEAQLQVPLRNCTTADSAAWGILSLGRTRKGRRQEVWKTAGWLSALAAFIFASFLVAGIFVGQISASSYSSFQVLAEAQACGFIDLNAGAAGAAGYNNININVSTNARGYARSCYGGGSIASPISCSVYPVQRLNYTVETEAQACPIPGGAACFTDDVDAAPVTLRTDVIDSHRHLGINAPKRDRLSMQYETTCAPLDYGLVDGFINTTTSSFDDTVFYPDRRNGTFEVYYMRPWNQTDFEAPYTFSYSPTPNGITFARPVDNSMFRTLDEPNTPLFGGAQYVPRRNVYLLACTEKWQVCNVRNSECTPWTTTLDLSDSDYWNDELGLNPTQQATHTRLISALLESSMYKAVFSVPDSLLAIYSLITTTGSQALPNTHWRREVEGWFQSVLAKWQFFPTIFVNIPLDILRANDVAFRPAGDEGAEMGKQCHQQRITAPQAYQSYNLFALVFIAFMGLLVPGIAVLLKSLAPFGPGPKEERAPVPLVSSRGTAAVAPYGARGRGV